MYQDFSFFLYKNNKLTYALYVILLVLSIFVTIFVAVNTPIQQGAELYFTLPLTFFLCLIFFKKIFPYHKGGFALKVFYFFCILRYLFLPFFTCSIGHFTSNWSGEAFLYAIIIQDIELITSFCAIKYYYYKKYVKISHTLAYKKSSFYENISLGGWLVIGVALLLIVSRGASFLNSMRFLVISSHLENEANYGYDIWMAHTMLAFLTVVITSTFQKRNEKSDSLFNIIIPIIISFLSVALVFGNNRMMTFYFAFSALSILSVSFPKYKKGISVALLAVVALVIFSFTMVKQYNVNISEGESAQVENESLARTIAVYVSSTEAVAKAYDMYAITGDQMRFGTVFADIVDKTMIFQLPGMPMKRWVRGITPSYKLAMTGVEVVPVAGQTLFYGGYVFGWLVDILVFWFVMWLLVTFEIHSKLEVNLGDRYLYTWMSVICAMVMCYHLGIMYGAFSYVPFFLWIAVSINRKLKINKKIIR